MGFLHFWFADRHLPETLSPGSVSREVRGKGQARRVTLACLVEMGRHPRSVLPLKSLFDVDTPFIRFLFDALIRRCRAVLMKVSPLVGQSAPSLSPRRNLICVPSR